MRLNPLGIPWIGFKMTFYGFYHCKSPSDHHLGNNFHSCVKVSRENGVLRPIRKNEINSYDLHSLPHFKELITVESSAGKYGIKTLIFV